MLHCVNEGCKEVLEDRTGDVYGHDYHCAVHGYQKGGIEREPIPELKVESGYGAKEPEENL